MSYVPKLHETPQTDINRIKKALSENRPNVIKEMAKKYPEENYWKKLLKSDKINPFEKKELINILYE